MRKIGSRDVNVNKAAIFAIAANGLQIFLMVCIAAYVMMARALDLDGSIERFVVLFACGVVVAGAAFDIRDALSTRKMFQQMDDMGTTIQNMEQFNNTLRSQRHDFLNHLQVVYSLMEMGENEEANAYIEKVYGAITSVSRAMKTANPAINALLQVKLSACEKLHIQVEINIQSSWKDLPIPGWEMCKVLGNLIDNAMDALLEVEDRKLFITLTEDLHAFRFSVANNGPMIPLKSQKKIFDPGITTKAEGHGMGLYIVRKTLTERGGDIALASDAARTEFAGWLPKEIRSIEHGAE